MPFLWFHLLQELHQLQFLPIRYRFLLLQQLCLRALSFRNHHLKSFRVERQLLELKNNELSSSIFGNRQLPYSNHPNLDRLPSSKSWLNLLQQRNSHLDFRSPNHRNLFRLNLWLYLNHLKLRHPKNSFWNGFQN